MIKQGLSTTRLCDSPRARPVVHRVPMGGPSSIDDLLKKQEGVVSRDQALEYLSRSAITRRIREAGPWQVLLPTVYGAFTGVPTERQRMWAALLYAGEDAFITGATGCRLYNLRAAPQCSHVHLAAPRGARPSVKYAVVHPTLRPASTWAVERFPVAKLPRVLVDTAIRLGSVDDVRALLSEGVQRRNLHVDQLIVELVGAPRNGSGFARRAVEEIVLGARSAPEGRVIRIVAGSTILPAAHHNCLVIGPGGTPLGSPDGYWEEAAVAQETDSVDHHYDVDAWAATLERRALFGAAGINVLPSRPRRLIDDADGVRRELESAYLIGVLKGPPPGIRVRCRPGCLLSQRAA